MSGSNASADDEGRTTARSALIIAASRYEDSRLSRLRAPAKDAEKLAAVLADGDIGDFAVEVLLDQPHGAVTRALSRFFRSRRTDDTLLVHFSCHGIKDEYGQLFFATTDTDIDDLEATGVASDWLRKLMDRCMSRRLLLILDCCYSGAIGRGMLARGDTGVHTKERLDGRGRAVITASDSVEYAFEGDSIEGEGTPSIFSSAVIAGLSTGAADRDGDGWITVDELYRHVHDTVREVTVHMTPRMWLLDVEGELRVAKNPRGPRAGQLPADLKQLMKSPFAPARHAAVDVLAGMLESGDPEENAAARAALHSLSGDDSRTVAAAAYRLLSSDPDVLAPASSEMPPEAPRLSWGRRRGHELLRVHHGDNVRAIAFSLDGLLLATASDDQTARIWRLDTGEEAARVTHDGSVRAVAFSADGRLLATASTDNTARLCDTADGNERARVIHDGAVRALAFNRDGSLLGTASDDRTARVWNIAMARELARVNHDASVWDVTFSRDDLSVASASTDMTARVWKIGSGPSPMLLAHLGAVWAVAFSPDGLLLATASSDKTGRTWDLSTGRVKAQVRHDNALRVVAFSPDGRLVATAGDDSNVRVWEPTTGLERAHLPHGGSAPTIAFSPDGRLLATGSRDRVARVWEIAGSDERARLLHDHTVQHVAFSADGLLLATASGSAVHVWHGSDGDTDASVVVSRR